MDSRIIQKTKKTLSLDSLLRWSRGNKSTWILRNPEPSTSWNLEMMKADDTSLVYRSTGKDLGSKEARKGQSIWILEQNYLRMKRRLLFLFVLLLLLLSHAHMGMWEDKSDNDIYNLLCSYVPSLRWNAWGHLMIYLQKVEIECPFRWP